MYDEGYECECIQETSSDLFCVICLKLMRNPVQFKCGHGMCFGCYKRLQNRYKLRSREAQCPQCREIIKESQIVSNIMLHRFILSLTVKCSNYNCQWIGELSHLEEHTEKCDGSMNVIPNETDISCDPESNSSNTSSPNETLLLQKINELIKKLENQENNNKSIPTQQQQQQQQQQQNTNKKKKTSAGHMTNHVILTNKSRANRNKFYFSVLFAVIVFMIYLCTGKLFAFIHKDHFISSNDDLLREKVKISRDHIFATRDYSDSKWVSIYQLFEVKLKFNLLELKMESDSTMDELAISNNEKKRALRNLDSLIRNDIILTDNEINKSINEFDEDSFQNGVVKNLNVLQKSFETMSNNLNMTIANRMSTFHTSWLDHEKLLSHKLLLKLQKVQTQVKYIADYNFTGNFYSKELTTLQNLYMTYQHKLTELSRSLDQHLFIEKMGVIKRNLTESYTNMFTGYIQNTTQKLTYVPRFQMLLSNLYKKKNLNGIYIWEVNVTHLINVVKKGRLKSRLFQISDKNTAELMISRTKKRELKLTYTQTSGIPKLVDVTVFSQLREEILLVKPSPNGNIEEVYKNGYQKVFVFPFTLKKMMRTGFILNDSFVIRCHILDQD